MSKVEEKLEAVARVLAEKGDDGQRLELVQRARRFKRSWVEMAEALCFVRDTGAYKRWGFADLHAYCAGELQLRGATVEKLLGSYATVRMHAPEVLQRDGVAQSIPTVDAVDYFTKAVTPRPENDAAPEDNSAVISDLRRAVFDDTKPLTTIRREFNPLLHPKSDSDQEREAIGKMRSTLRRFNNLLDHIPSLPAARVEKVRKAMAGLERDLDALSADSERLAG